jgi:crotonobetainyl-CoA:carnitine CoA-transferase CaiB-like acyl-CoA transferase
MQTFFKDLKVVELASVLAGPAVGMFFAELGAEVIKIENKTTGGDVTRGWKLPSEHTPLAPKGETITNTTSAYFHSVNYHKTHYFFDLQDITDKEKTLEILRGCDVVISNFRKSSAVKMGMDYDSITAINPNVIYAQLYGFDEEDETPAFDVVLQAEAGFMYMTGEKGRGAVKMPVALIDILAAHQLKEGILMALLARDRTGKGAFVSTTLYEAAVASLANQATNWLMVGHIPQRIGAEHPNIAPYGDVFITKDKKEIVLACGTEKQWQTLCKILIINELADDKRFETNILRVKNRVKLVKILRGYILAHERDTLLSLLQKASVPAGAIRNMQEVFENPMAQKMILAEATPEGGVTKRVRTVTVDIKQKK